MKLFSHYLDKFSLRLMVNYLYTKLFYPQSRIIRLPFYVRGRRHMNLGKRLTTGVGCRLDAFPSEPKVVLHVTMMFR